MKLTLVLLSALLAICQVKADSPAFTIDRQYVYKYSSRTATGIPEKGIMQFSGLGIKGDVTIQNQGSYVFVKFNNVEIGPFNKKFDVDLDDEFPIKYFPVDKQSSISDSLSKPLRVTADKGLVKSFDAYVDDPEWSINIKKSILTLFQLNFDRVDYIRFSKSNYLKPEDSTNFYRVMEGGVGGECETVYDINSIPYFNNPYEQVLNVTKYKLYDKCSHRPTKLFTTHLGYKCTDCEQFSFKPITTDSETHYNIRGNRHYYTIEKIKNIAHFVITPFTSQSETIISGSNQTLTLFETTPIDNPIKFPEKYTTYTSLSYNIIATPENPTGVDLKKSNHPDIPVEHKIIPKKETVKTLLSKISEIHELTDDMHDEHNVPKKFWHLISTLSFMDYDDIKDAYDTYVNYDYATATPEKQRMKSTFVEALTFVGTNPAVVFLLETVLNAPVPLPEFIQSYPFYVKVPSEALIKKVYELTKSVDKTAKGFSFYSSMWLAFGTLLHRGCENIVGSHDEGFHHPHHHKFLIQPETCKTYSTEIYKRFVEAKTTKDKLLYIKVLGNIALIDTYVYLKPIVTGEEYQPEPIRLQAFWTLMHYTGDLKEEVLTLVVPIVSNYSEPVEIRIAAFDVVLATEPSTLAFLFEVLHHEPSKQFVSYIYSSLTAYANSSQPCDFKLAKLSRKVLKFLEPKKFGLHYSNNLHYDYYNDKYGFGGSSWFSWFGSNDSFIPEVFYWEQSANVFGYNFDVFSVGIEAKGTPKKMVDHLFSGLGKSKYHRYSKDFTFQKEMDEIYDALKFNFPKNPKSEIGFDFTWFGQDISFDYLNEEDLNTALAAVSKDLNEKSIFEKPFTYEKAVNYQKNAFIAEVLYFVPSEIGMPLRIHVAMPAYLSLTGDVKFNVLPSDDSQKFAPRFELKTNLKTIFHTKSIVKAGLFTPLFNTLGYATESDFIVKLPLKLDVVVDTKDEKFSVNYEPSKTPYEMFHYDVKPVTFTGSPLLENYTPLPIVYNPEPHVLELSVGHTHFGAGLKIYRKQEQDWDSFSSYYKYFTSFFTKKGRTFDAYKYPYNTVEKLVEGFMSMTDYYLLYPTMTPYEFKVFFEPSTQNPTSEYELTVAFNEFYKTSTGIYESDYTKPVVIKMDPTFRKVYGVSADLIAKGTVQRSYHGDLNISYPSISKFPTKITFDYWRTPVPNYDSNPFKLCYRASLTIPEFTKFYSIDKYTKLQAEFNNTIFFGKECETDKKIAMNLVISKTDKQKEYDAAPTMNKYYNKCEEDKKYGYNYTKACRKYFLKYYTLKQYEVDIEYDSVPEILGTTVDGFTNYFKHLYYTNVEKLDKHATSNPPGHIKIKVNVSSDSPARLDLKVYRPYQTVYYKDIYYPAVIPFVESFNVRRTPSELYFKKKFPLASPPTCSLQKNYTETFDGVVYHYPLSTCYQVLLTESNKYQLTVLAKKVEHQTYKFAVKLFVVNHKIEILPIGENTATAPLVLRIDDVKQALPSGNLYYMPLPNDKTKTLLKIYNFYNTYIIKVPTHKLVVIYSGDFLKVELPNALRGELRGLCGDFNGETQYEFVGPNGCVYTDEEEFAKSYIVPDGSCTPPTTDKPHCYYPYAPTYPGKCTFYLNKVIHDVAIDRSGRTANNACFSTVPIPQCASGCKPSTYVKRKIGFHCLNKRDSYTKLLIEASKTRDLPEIRYKSEDYYETVDYPERCVKA